MRPDEAARVAEMLGVKLAVGCHYFTHNADTAEFLKRVPVHDTTGARQAYRPAARATLSSSMRKSGLV